MRARPQPRAPMFAPYRLRGMELKTASSSRRWRNTGRSTARRPTGTSSTMASAPGRAGLVFIEMTVPGASRELSSFYAGTRTAGNGSSISSMPKPANLRRSAIPGQRIDQLGRGCRRALKDGNWPLLSASNGGRTRRRRRWTGPTWTQSRQFVAAAEMANAAASTCSNCTWRTAISSPPSSLR